MRAVISSNKHIVQTIPTSVAAGANTAINLAEAVDVPAAGNALEIKTGSIIKVIYLEYWYTSNSTARGSCQTSIEKVPGSNQGVMGNADANTLHAYDNKKNILELHQGLLPPNVENPLSMFRHWVKIPKGKQRMGLGDKLNLNFNSIIEGTVICGVAVYKEYN